MRYHPTGVDRDSFVSGVRTGRRFADFHDVNKRRDNLPENVFSLIRDEVIYEERARLLEEERRACVQLLLLSSSGKGKRMAGGAAGDERCEIQRAEELDSINARHRALLELYSMEMDQWKAELAHRGLSPQM